MGVSMGEVSPERYGRRAFLVRSGVIGAAIALVDVPTLLEPTKTGAAGPSLAELAPVFDALSKDTMNGLVAFVVPGPDLYSLAQGVHDTAPGGLAADGSAFMLNALDNFYPVPQEPLLLLVQALATGISSNLPAVSCRRSFKNSPTNSTRSSRCSCPARRRSRCRSWLPCCSISWPHSSTPRRSTVIFSRPSPG